MIGNRDRQHCVPIYRLVIDGLQPAPVETADPAAPLSGEPRADAARRECPHAVQENTHRGRSKYSNRGMVSSKRLCVYVVRVVTV